MMDVNIIAMYFLVSCSPLSLPDGLVNYTKSLENGRYPVDTVASFACNSGYYENGTILRTCQASNIFFILWQEEHYKLKYCICL